MTTDRDCAWLENRNWVEDLDAQRAQAVRDMREIKDRLEGVEAVHRAVELLGAEAVITLAEELQKVPGQTP